jgi:hypothetical protein
MTPTTHATPTRRRARWPRLLVAATCVALVGAGCTATRTAHFGVDVGYGIYVRIYQLPTAQVVLYNDAEPAGPWFCGGNEVCTLRFLRNQIHVNWVGTNPIVDIDHFFEDVQQGDFANALDQVRATNPQRCLMLHRNSTPGGDHHNWTSSNPGGSCQQGVLVQL